MSLGKAHMQMEDKFLDNNAKVDSHSNTAYWEWKNDGSTNLRAVHKNVLGYTEEQLPYVNQDDYMFAEDRKKVNEAFAKHVQEKNPNPIQFEMRFKKPDGQIIWVQSIGSVTDWAEDGSPMRISGFTIDITKQRLSEHKLKISEQQFKGAFEITHSGMGLVSLDGKWLKVNKQLCNMLGYKEEELLATTFQQITHPLDLESDLALVNKLLIGELASYQLEKRYIKKDGSPLWVLLSVSLVKDEFSFPLHFVTVIADISQIKANENEMVNLLNKLEIADSRWKAASEGAREGFWDWDLESNHFSYNDFLPTMLGYSHNEMETFFLKLLEYVHPDDKEEVEEELERVISGKSDIFDREYRFCCKDGNYLWIWSRGKVMGRNKDNSAKRIVGFISDIEKKKKQELEFMNYMDIISDQNKRLINFAHIVGHNLRSHAANFEMILHIMDTLKDEQKKREFLLMLKDNSKSLSSTIQNLQEIVSVQTNVKVEKQPLVLAKFIKKTLDVLSGEINSKQAKVETNVSPDVVINYNPAYMESILLNFISNAIKYSSPNRQPEISINYVSGDAQAVLEIKDNGMGIDLTKNEKLIFGMYNTFHGNEDALGIGLFITKNQVEAMGGKIWVESAVDQGSSFKISMKQ